MEWTAKHKPEATTLAMTCHGVGYGLDEREAFLSLLTGMMSAELPEGHSLRKVVIAEHLAERAERLNALLTQFEAARDDAPATADEQAPQRQRAANALLSMEQFSALLRQSFGART